MAAATTTYHGNCHCGRFRFDVAAPEITHAVACACSLCAKKGYLWLVPAEGGFRVTRDEGRLKSYESASLRDQVSCLPIQRIQRRVVGNDVSVLRTLRYRGCW